ncbi:MAG: zinc-ribbon domain-containing protein [Deltaproteobacteria bacterium]|nr:zinc-ribbon domain-containing protein [Deltaproteobacteria bacterium]
MKFVCDKCGTGYTIPDHKVAGRILKIRCKHCRAVVEVMGPPPAGSGLALALEPVRPATPGQTALQRMAAAVAAGGQLEHRLAGVHLPRQISGVKHQLELESSTEVDDEQWFAAIKGHRIGPLSRAEILVCARRGTIHERSYVWRPGMTGWQRIHESAELAFLAEALGRRQMLASAQRVAAALQPGLFSSMLSPASVPEQPTRPPTAAPPPIARENSDWFVLDERQQSALWERSAPAVMEHRAPLVTGTHLLPGKRPLRTALAVLTLAVLFGAGVIALAWQQRDWLARSAKPLTSAVAEVVEATPARGLVEQVRQALDPDREQGVRWPAREQPQPSARPAAPRPAMRPRIRATPIEIHDLGAAATGSRERDPIRHDYVVRLPAADAVDTWVVQQLRPPEIDLGAPAAAAAPTPSAPVDLTADDVVRVVAERRPQLESCYTAVLKQYPGLSGGIEATIVINLRGRVGPVSISGGGDGAEQLARCMQQRMRRWRFPPPTTELEVVMPIRLSQVH